MPGKKWVIPAWKEQAGAGEGTDPAQGLFRCCKDWFCTVFLFLMAGPTLPALHNHLLTPIPQAPPAPCLWHMETEPEHALNDSSSSQGVSQLGAKQEGHAGAFPAGSVAFCPLLEGN